MSAAAAQSDRPYFAFEQDVRPVPETPTHCKCGEVLEPLRRYAGLCKSCVRARSHGAAAPRDELQSVLVLVRWFYKQRPSGHRERYVEVECACKRRRTMQWRAWAHHRPLSCKRCRIDHVNARGFEAEYGR